MDNLTVIIPYRNGEATLSALLDSLPPNLPTLVVDDQSDVTPRYIGRHRQVQFMRMPVRGYFSGAVNAGINACKTDVLVLNQDVRFEDDSWQGLINDQRGEYALIGDGVMNHPAWPKGYVQGTFMFMRRDAIEAVGLLDAINYPLWGATAEWQLRAVRGGFRALPTSPIVGLVHARGKQPFGSAIKATLEEEPEQRKLLLRTPPAISVICTCYNYGRYLQELYNSLFGGPTCLGEMEPQTFQSFELIIVNDASTDETHEVASRLADDWKGVKYVHNKTRLGTAEAINSGVRVSHGKYVTHVCADDMMRKDRLEYLYRAAEANPGKMIYDDMDWFKEGKIFFNQKLPEYDFEALVRRNYYHTGIIFARSDWERVGGWPSVMANGREDWAMNVRLGRAGVCGVHVSEAGYLYRREEQNRTLTNTGGDWQQFFLDKMRALFPDIYSGERPMGCCGGGKQLRKSNNGNGANGMVAFSVNESAPEGMVRVEYLGSNDGNEAHRGALSRRIYVFNRTKRKFGYVEQRDLETGNMRNPGLLEKHVRGEPLFRLAPVSFPEPPVAVKEPVKETSEPVVEEQVVFAAPDEDVAGLVEEQAAPAKKTTKRVPRKSRKQADD